jgi:hypothetical protein
MAENIKRRVAAARLAVAFVAAGTIAGATAWAQAGPPPPTAQSSAFDAFAKVHLDSSNIKNGSLLFQDFKADQVLSADAFFKYKKTETSFKKAVNNFKYDIKGELGDVNGDISTIKGELGTIKGELPSYIKMSDADARYIKMNDAIMGDGSVFTATQAVPQGSNGVTLLDLPGLVKVVATEADMKITNTGGGTLTHSSCGTVGQGGFGAGVMAPGDTLSCATGEHAEPVQFISGNGQVATVNLSNLAMPAVGGSQATVQILIGLL